MPIRALSALPRPSQNTQLARFSEERGPIIEEVVRRVYAEYLVDAKRGDGLEYVLNDAAYREVSRLGGPSGPEDEIRSRSWWVRTSKRLAEMSEREKRDVLVELARAYAEDIAGQFRPAVYDIATKALPLGLGLLFKAQDLRELPGALPDVRGAARELRDLSQRIVIDGDLATLRALAERGTLLFVPTHTSNMDSILVGYSLFAGGLPPVTYGAGKNLFSNPLTSFVMHNVGAYKLDRRIQHDLYKRILKTYSQVLLERGYHALFFPGGTRCRSNVVESHLKLGLLGTAISAYVRGLIERGKEERIYICPLTINYNLVLEAENLIRDHLRREGGARYLLEEDPFDDPRAVARFVMNTMRMDATTQLRFGEPMDPFGNAVDARGDSLDARGRRVDPTSFVRSARSGEVVADEARDRELTTHCGAQIARSFRRNTVLMPTQIVSYALFELLRRRFPRWDVWRLLRLGGEEVIGWEELRAAIDRLIAELRRRADRGEFYLSPFVRAERPARVAEVGVDYLRMYHVPPVVDFDPSGVRLDRLDLLFFYSNRLRVYDLDDAWLTPIA